MRASTPLVAASILSSGCALQLGGHGGVVPSPTRLVHGASVAAYTAPIERGAPGFPHIGVELEGEVEHQVAPRRDTLGTGYSAGLQAGYSYWFRASPLSLQTYGNVGTGIAESPYDGYAGATIALPIELAPTRDVTEMNHMFQLVARRISVVPSVRWRAHWNDDMVRNSGTVGVALRARLSTDLL